MIKLHDEIHYLQNHKLYGKESIIVLVSQRY